MPVCACVLTICNMCFVTDANFKITTREPISPKTIPAIFYAIVLLCCRSDLAPCVLRFPLWLYMWKFPTLWLSDWLTYLMKNAILIIGAIDAFPNRIYWLYCMFAGVFVDRALRHIPTDASIWNDNKNLNDHKFSPLLCCVVLWDFQFSHEKRSTGHSIGSRQYYNLQLSSFSHPHSL